MFPFSWGEDLVEGLKNKNKARSKTGHSPAKQNAGVDATKNALASGSMPLSALDISENAMIYYTPEGVRRFANRAARRLFTHNVGMDFTFYTTGSFCAFIEENAYNLLLEKDSQNVVSQIHCNINLRDRIYVVRFERLGTGDGILYFNDMTDVLVLQSEAGKIWQQKVEKDKVLEAFSGGVAFCCALDGKSIIQFANRNFLAMTGLQPNMIPGADMAAILERALKADARALNDAMKNEKSATIEWQMDSQNAPPQWFEAVLAPIRDAGGLSGSHVWFLEDITKAHIQKAQLFQSQKLEALGQLAGGVAHDFNNLLSIVDGYTRMAIKFIDEDNKAYNYLERIKQANRRGAALTKQLLTFGRHKIVTDQVIDLSTAVREQEPLLHSLLNASIALVIREEPGISVACASDSIAQILMNLVINSRDAMQDGGTIVVSVSSVEGKDLPAVVSEERRKDGFACLSVEDTGKGMDQKTVARIFDPFFTTKDQGKGSGLGLSMVYGIVQQEGGFIDVSTAPGVGTAMRLYFPKSDKIPQKKPVSVKQDGKGQTAMFEGYTALVVEDEPDLLFVVGGMLEDMGMRVIKASDGNDALVKQDGFEEKIDFLLTDVVMPELNGVRLAEMMGELRPETRIVFMSGYPASGIMSQVKLPDNAWLLAKPIEFEKLSSVLVARMRDDSESGRRDGTRGMYRWQSSANDSEDERIQGKI